ncbi:hypothetical protein BDW71DRAFT_26208 [Aspergillus fruticulosus]
MQMFCSRWLLARPSRLYQQTFAGVRILKIHVCHVVLFVSLTYVVCSCGIGIHSWTESTPLFALQHPEVWTVGRPIVEDAFQRCCVAETRHTLNVGIESLAVLAAALVMPVLPETSRRNDHRQAPTSGWVYLTQPRPIFALSNIGFSNRK